MDDDDSNSQYSQYSSEEESDSDIDGEERPAPMVLPRGPQAALLASFLAQMPPEEASDLVAGITDEDDDDDDCDPAASLWMEHMAAVQASGTKRLKVTDDALQWYWDQQEEEDLPDDDDTDTDGQVPGEAPMRPGIDNNSNHSNHINTLPVDPPALVAQITAAVAANRGLTHVILGRRVWQLLGASSTEQSLQRRLLQALSRHAATVTYLKMGTEERDAPLCERPATTEALLHTWTAIPWSALTEIEVRGLVLSSPRHVERLTALVCQTPTLKQVNLLGFFVHPALLEASDVVTTPPLLDGLLQAAAQVPGLDELRLSRCVTPDTTDIPALVSPEVLQALLAAKPKWWRLGLDGLGLRDRHVQVLAQALVSAPACKMGDLLSLTDNPHVRDYASLLRVCSSKGRMGSVQVDDPSWVATFDLVRSLNNLHRRLDYVVPETGGYPNRARWMDWLSVVGNLPWQDEAHKLNYLWFTLLEQPDFVRPMEGIAEA
jgi:hypothetical protein